RMQRLFTQEVIHFFHAGFFLQVQRQNGHGHVRSRNADGVTGQQTFQFRQRLGDGFGRTGFSDHHVQRRRTTTTVTCMVVVDLERSDCSRRKLFTSSTLVSFFRFSARMAMDTFGVGTRMALPVSRPFSSGSALATALAAPVSVITMFSGAERPRRSPLW